MLVFILLARQLHDVRVPQHDYEPTEVYGHAGVGTRRAVDASVCVRTGIDPPAFPAFPGPWVTHGPRNA